MEKTVIDNNLKKLILSAMFLSIGVVLPLLTGSIKEIGDSLLPMHIPILLCGLVCGPKFGALTGFILPIFRALTFGMPPIYPNAIWMAFELATYGLVIGLLYSRFKQKSVKAVYISLIASMILGRVVWGVVKTLLLGIGSSQFGFYAFLIGGFVDALPGIVLQLILIPLIMAILNKFKLKTEKE